MHTYRDDTVDWNTPDFPASPGPADATTWRYDPGTGLLTAKEDATGNAVAYTYARDGTLATRTCARPDGTSPLVTTYGYDPATPSLTLSQGL